MLMSRRGCFVGCTALKLSKTYFGTSVLFYILDASPGRTETY
jgi:hypothetical protein